RSSPQSTRDGESRSPVLDTRLARNSSGSGGEWKASRDRAGPPHHEPRKARAMTTTREPRTSPSVQHARLSAWVDEIARLARPEAVVWCDGSSEEYESLCELLVAQGTMVRLDPVKRPRSFLARSNPEDV